MSVRLCVDQFRRSASKGAVSSTLVLSASTPGPVYIVAMHGFLAHSGSLQTFFRALTAHIDAVAAAGSHKPDIRIICPDARNHGLSPHTATHYQSDLIKDLQWLLHTPSEAGYGLQAIAPPAAPLSPESTEAIRVVALGHSMGSGTWGRYLMEHKAHESLRDLVGGDTVARTRPVHILGFIALDMPPITASQWSTDLHRELADVVDAMETVNLRNISDYRSAHEEFLQRGITDIRMRGMCSTNLLLPPPRGSAAASAPGATTATRWKCNLPVLKTALDKHTLFFSDTYFTDREKAGLCTTVPVPVLSLLGGDSPVGADHRLRGLWGKHAVEAEEHVVPGATHTIYFDRPKETSTLTVDFLRRLGIL